jgi:heme/copper-type cytochrome/quinol oxidase subunit 2
MMETKKNSKSSQHPDSAPSWKLALILGLIGTGFFVVIILVIFIVASISKSTGDPQLEYKIEVLVPVFIGITAFSYIIQKLIFK